MESNWIGVGEILNQIAARCRELGAMPNPDWAALSLLELGQAIRVSEARVRLECDELLRTLARPGNAIGTPTPMQAYFCRQRALCALDTLSVIHTELDGRALYPSPPNWPTSTLLEWLLVSNWQQRHDVWLKLCAYGLATGNAYFGG